MDFVKLKKSQIDHIREYLLKLNIRYYNIIAVKDSIKKFMENQSIGSAKDKKVFVKDL